MLTGAPKFAMKTSVGVGVGIVISNVGGVPDYNRSVTLFFYNAMTKPIWV